MLLLPPGTVALIPSSSFDALIWRTSERRALGGASRVPLRPELGWISCVSRLASEARCVCQIEREVEHVHLLFGRVSEGFVHLWMRAGRAWGAAIDAGPLSISLESLENVTSVRWVIDQAHTSPSSSAPPRS